MLKKGIILIATGNPYYGRMAYNLALTIRFVDKSIPIAVIFNDGALYHLSSEQLEIFTDLIALPPEVKPGFGVKTHLYDLTPFEETLFLDVDMAWLPYRTPAELFMEVQDVPFSSITEGYYDIKTKDSSNSDKNYYYWAKPEHICEHYELTTGKIYQWRSEVIYFRKCDKVKKLFDSAKEIYENHGLKEIIKFYGETPDELAFNIAAAVHSMHPHMYKWKPSFWPRMHGDNVSNPAGIYSQYYLLSCGSNISSKATKTLYDKVVSNACRHIGKQHLFPLISKADFIKERKKM